MDNQRSLKLICVGHADNVDPFEIVGILKKTTYWGATSLGLYVEAGLSSDEWSRIQALGSVSTFGTPKEVNKFLRSQIKHKVKEENILKQIGEWISAGFDDHPNSDFQTDEGIRLPLHPGFWYRLSGDEFTWCDALGQRPGHENYEENMLQDALEDIAFERLKNFMGDVNNNRELHVSEN